MITPALNDIEKAHEPSAQEPGDPVTVDLAALQAGDEAAWTVAFRQLWSVALVAARHPSACLADGEPEDAAMEALEQLIGNIHLVRSVDELKALLATIAFRRAISMSRKKFASKRGPGTISLDDAVVSEGNLRASHATQEDCLSDMEAAEVVLLLQRALSDLDRETRTLLEEKHLSGSTYEELSARHGIPLGTACAKVARGLKKVRQRVENFPAVAKELRSFLR